MESPEKKQATFKDVLEEIKGFKDDDCFYIFVSKFDKEEMRLMQVCHNLTMEAVKLSLQTGLDILNKKEDEEVN